MILLIAEGLTSFFATHILVVSHSLRDEYVRRRLAPRSKLTVLGRGSSHGVATQRGHIGGRVEDSKILRKLQQARADNRPIICFAGRFSADKGSRVIGQLRRTLFEEGFDHEFLLLGAIEDSPKALASLSSETKRPPLYAGEVESIFPYLRYVSVMVLPSLREGFPNVVLEAAVMSVPTVTTSATGAIDSVAHGVTGLVVPPKDPEAFSAAVLALLSDNELRQDMGQRARLLAMKHYSSRHVSRLHAHYYSGKVQERLDQREARRF